MSGSTQVPGFCAPHRNATRRRNPPGLHRSPGACRALRTLAVLAFLPAACASAQGVPDSDPAPAPDERIQAPDWTPEPGTPTAWMERGLQDPSQDPPTLVVRGQGEVQVDPDRARISFAVETEHETARGAAEENARRMTRVMEGVRTAGEGVPGFRVETSGYSLTPRYQTRRETGVREIVGYTARNHAVVTLDRVDEVGRIMDVALQSGANRMAGLQFLLQDAEPHRAAALREAVRKARTEAEILAEALGVRLGPPVHVEGGAELPTPWARGDMAVAAMAMEAAPTTPVEAGVQTVTASVTIRFRLDPPR